MQIREKTEPIARQDSNCSWRCGPARRREQSGTQSEVLEHPVCGHQAQIGLVRRQRGELTTALLGGRVVISVQQDRVADGTSAYQPLDGDRILIEPVAV